MDGGRPARKKLELDLLANRGWIVGEARYHGEDLEIDVEYKGVRGRVWIFGEPKGFSYRVNLGEPTDQIAGCAVWEQDDSYDRMDKDPLQLQAAFGTGWTAATLSHQSVNAWSSRVGYLFDIAAFLHFAESDEARRQHLRTYCR